MSGRRSRIAKWALPALAGVILALLAVLWWGGRSPAPPEEAPVPASGDTATVSMEGLRHVATRNGRTEWELEADAADFAETLKQVRLKNVRVLIHLETGDRLRLKADGGLLRTDSNDMEVSGNVVVEAEESRLTTDRLLYEHEGRRIFAPAAVLIAGAAFSLEAGSLRMDLDTRRIVLENRVTGAFSESIGF